MKDEADKSEIPNRTLSGCIASIDASFYRVTAMPDEIKM